LIRGGRGIFDVKIAGQMLFSKRQTERFPHDGELAQLFEAMQKVSA